MKTLLILILLFVSAKSYSQIEIDSLVYNFKLDDNCYAYYIDYTIPKINSDKEIIKIVNDSILTIAKSYLDHNPAELFEDFFNREECDVTFNQAPQSSTISFQVFKNTTSLLSLTIFYRIEQGNGGHGSGWYTYHFNIDLLNNKSLSEDDLFDTNNKKKLFDKIKNKWNEEIGGFEVDGSQIKYEGFSITNKNFVATYSMYMGHSITQLETVEIPISEVKLLSKKEYKWIFE